MIGKKIDNATRARTSFDTRWVLKRVAFFGPIAVVASLTLAERSSHPDSQKTDLTSINHALISADAMSGVTPLSFADGDVDVLYVGAPECSQCRDFVADGFSGMVDATLSRGVDFAYMPMATSEYGVSLEAAKTCVPLETRIASRYVVMETYKAMKDMEATTQQVNTQLAQGEITRQQGADSLRQTLAEFQAAIGGEGVLDEVCYQRSFSRISRRMKKAENIFGLTRLPAFYIATPDGVERLASAPDLSRFGSARSGR